MLFNLHEGLYYYYFPKSERVWISSGYHSRVAVSDDLSYVFFVEEEMESGGKMPLSLIKMHNTNGTEQQIFYEGKEGESIDSLFFHDNYVYFTMKEADKETLYAKAVFDKEKIPALEQEYSVPVTGLITKNSKGLYIYRPETKSLELIAPPGKKGERITVETENEMENPWLVKINDENDVFVIYEDAKGNVHKSVNGKNVGEFTYLDDVVLYEWYDNRHLIVWEYPKLYLLDSETLKEKVLATGVNSFALDGADVYYNDENNRLFRLKRK